MSDLWTQFGFRESLYGTTPIPGTKEGQSLLVGRETEKGQIKTLLAATSLLPTIEGDVGIGKTSLVAVAGFELAEAFKRGNTSTALIPVHQVLQLTPGQDVSEFRRRVLLLSANALIDNVDLLKERGHEVPDVKEMRKWLTQVVQKQGSGGATVFGTGANVSGGVSPNLSSGFSEVGVATTIERWLAECFPSTQHGGFVFLIDNLELLQTHKAARSMVEAMRDDVFALPGLRFILCGSRGIVRPLAASSRLQGRLAEPIVVGPLDSQYITEVVAKRRSQYRLGHDTTPPVAPVGRDGFALLYSILNGNLRNSLSYAEQFALWLGANNDPPWDADANFDLLDVWLSELADAHLADTRLGEAAWKVFDRLISLGGACSPSDFEEFGYQSMPALRPQIKQLEEVNLVDSVIDDSDKRRKTISVTSRGWLVSYSRSNYAARQEVRSAWGRDHHL
jgi:hypothetical protein